MRLFSSLVFFLASILAFPFSVCAQNPPASDPQALTFAAQSIAALTGGASISDVTFTGSATWNGTNASTATLMALGIGESRMDLALTSGTRSEIRDAQTGTAIGQWTNPDNSRGAIALQNCQADAAWFFPVLGSLAVAPNVVLSYIGQESLNGTTVQHIQSYVYDPNWPADVTPTDQQMSTMDFYLDATTLLPTAIMFNAYPDNSVSSAMPTEVDFSNYQNISGIVVPMHIQKFSQGNLQLDLTLNAATFNTGLTLSLFAIN